MECLTPGRANERLVPDKPNVPKDVTVVLVWSVIRPAVGGEVCEVNRTGAPQDYVVLPSPDIPASPLEDDQRRASLMSVSWLLYM